MIRYLSWLIVWRNIFTSYRSRKRIQQNSSNTSYWTNWSNIMNCQKKIINDRDRLFTFNYWKTLISLLNVKFRLFTAYHSKIDDQIKRINQNLEQYLRHYVNKTQYNWIEILFMTQLALNSKMSNTTKITSFFVNFEKKSNLFEHEKSHLSAQSTLNRVKTLKNIHVNISQMQKKFTRYLSRSTVR